MRTLLFICTFSGILFGQTYKFEQECDDARLKCKMARKYKLKTVSAFDFKNEKSKKGKFISKESYDPNGNLLKVESNKQLFYNNKSYYYNEKNELVKIVPDYSSGTVLELSYLPDGKTAYIIQKAPNYLTGDTFFYDYYTNGKLNNEYFVYSDGTESVHIYYHYNDKGEHINKSTEPVDDTDNRILDKHGCIIGYTTDTTDINTFMERDSLCRVTSWKTCSYYKGTWVALYGGENTYSNGKVIEQKYWVCDKEKDYNICVGKLVLSTHTKFQYNEQGLILKETSLNKKGKVIWVRRYIYETYE